ncbi:MAG: DNA primase [Chloroflexi bacterium]|nr:DNA primase [Chloroflexota bacterium]
MSSIEEIKARIEIVDLVSETVKLRRSGKSYTGFCPFHSNTKTPAFVVFPETGTWRCFGQCNEGGDIFSYMMKKEGWEFGEALRFLAEKAGVTLKPPTPEEQVAAEEHAALRALLEDAATYYRHQLLQTPAGAEALAYLRQRGLQDDTIEAFGLGYAPQSWDALLAHFRGRGVSEHNLLEAGLLTEREGGGWYDRFRRRIMFPIRDERGRMAGFGARILNPDDVPKFLNSPQTSVFDKGHLLYGLDRARKAIHSADQVVIVEGYLDVIALHQAGFANAVSPMGVALTERQLLLLKRYTRRMILALDPDAAGAQATLRGLEVARQSLDREQEAVFDARGLLGYEARLQADLRVAALPEGMDPDEVALRDPQEWRRVVEAARPVVIHVMETLAASRDLNDPKAKREIAAQVLPLIADVSDAIERDTYRQRLARLLRVDERTLLEEAPPSRQRPAPRRRAPARVREQAEAARPPADSTHAVEAHILGVLLRRPDLLYPLDRNLQAEGLGRLTLDDFQHADHQAVFRLLQASIEQDVAEPLHYVLESLSLPMMEAADRLLAQTQKLAPEDPKNEERLLADLLRSTLAMRRRNLRQYNEHLRFLQEDAVLSGDLLAAEYSKIMVYNNRILHLVDKAMGRYTDRAAMSR